MANFAKEHFLIGNYVMGDQLMLKIFGILARKSMWNKTI